MIGQYSILAELNTFFVKIGIPAAIGITVKLATQAKRGKISVIQFLLSYITGIGCAYFAYPFINDTKYVSIVIAIIAISSEKIMEFLIYTWNIDFFLKSLSDAIRDTIVKMIKR